MSAAGYDAAPENRRHPSLQPVARWRSWMVQYVLDPVTRACALVKSSQVKSSWFIYRF